MAVPKHIVPPPRKGPVRMRKSGAGFHRTRRPRGAERRAAISREVAAQ